MGVKNKQTLLLHEVTHQRRIRLRNVNFILWAEFNKLCKNLNTKTKTIEMSLKDIQLLHIKYTTNNRLWPQNGTISGNYQIFVKGFNKSMNLTTRII